MAYFPGNGDPGLATRQSRIRIAEQPIGPPGESVAIYARILAVEKGVRAMATYVVEVNAILQVLDPVFEDAHWIDPTSQEMLDLMVPQIAGQRVLLVASYRPEYEPPWPQGLGHLTTVNLNRLGRKQAAAMVARVTGGKSLPNEVLEQIVAKTDGVPLFVEELTKTVIESGMLREAGDRYELTGPLTDLAIPSTIQDSLMARLDRLAPVKEVAQIGACIGREFGYELVAALCAMDEKTLTESLQQLELGELIFGNGTPPNATYTFKHALVQETAYESLLRSKRQRTHYDIARTLQDRFGEAVESNPELLAHHFSAAGRKTEAVDFWTRAGKRAIRNSANREAISFLTKALDLLTSSDDIPDQLRKELDLRISLGAPLQALEGYGSPNVERTYRQAHDLCERVGQTPDLGRALRGLYVFSLMRGELVRAQRLHSRHAMFWGQFHPPPCN